MKRIIIISVLTLAVAALAGCGIQNSNQLAATETIKIGVILPLTGTSADNGNNIKNGLLLAQKEINKSNKYQIELIFEDSQFNSEKAVTAAMKLINIDKVGYIIGDVGSSQSLAIAPLAEKNKILMISPASQTDKLTDAGDYIFRIYPSTRQEVEYFSGQIKKIIGDQRLALLAYNIDSGNDYITDFNKYYQGTISNTDKFNIEETDFRSYLLKIKKGEAAYVLAIGNRKMVGSIMKQAKEGGYGFKFFLNSIAKGNDLIKVAGTIADGAILPDQTYATDTLAYKDFSSKYSASFGQEPELFSAKGYDVLKVLDVCLEKDGNQVEKIKDCLYSIKDYKGIGGDIGFDQNGDILNPQFGLDIIKNGQFVPYQN